MYVPNYVLNISFETIVIQEDSHFELLALLAVELNPQGIDISAGE
jgi:hypothetical protein